MHDSISLAVEHIFDQIAEADVLEELCQFALAAQLHLAAFNLDNKCGRLLKLKIEELIANIIER